MMVNLIGEEGQLHSTKDTGNMMYTYEEDRILITRCSNMAAQTRFSHIPFPIIHLAADNDRCEGVRLGNVIYDCIGGESCFGIPFTPFVRGYEGSIRSAVFSAQPEARKRAQNKVREKAIPCRFDQHDPSPGLE